MRPYDVLHSKRSRPDLSSKIDKQKAIVASSHASIGPASRDTAKLQATGRFTLHRSIQINPHIRTPPALDEFLANTKLFCNYNKHSEDVRLICQVSWTVQALSLPPP